MCKKCNISSGSLSVPHIKLCFHDLAAFVEFLKGHELGSVFREHISSDEADLTYTAYDAKAGIFVTCTTPVPLLLDLLGLSVGQGRGYYSNHGFKVEQNQGIFAWQNKRYWVKALKAINVATPIVSSLEKIKASELGKLAEDDDDEELDENGQISTDKRKAAPFPTKVACDTVDSIVKEVTVDVAKSYSNITYRIIVNDWSNIVAESINKFEKQIIDKGISIVPGSLQLLGT